MPLPMRHERPWSEAPCWPALGYSSLTLEEYAAPSRAAARMITRTMPLQPFRLPDGIAFAHTLYSASRSLVVFQNELLVASKEYVLVRDSSETRR